MNLTKSDLYKDIIERFNSKRLPYAIIKNYESFPSVVNDLDLIADFSQIKNFIEEIKNYAKENKLIFIIDNHSYSRRNYYKFYIFHIFGCSEENKTIINARIELFNGFYTGGILLFDSYSIIKTRKLFKNIFIMHPKYEYIFLLFGIHNCFKCNRSIRKTLNEKKYQLNLNLMQKYYSENKIDIDNLFDNFFKIKKADFYKLINKKESLKFIIFLDFIKIKTFIKKSFINPKTLYFFILKKVDYLLFFINKGSNCIYKAKMSYEDAINLREFLLKQRLFRVVFVLNNKNSFNQLFQKYRNLNFGGIIIDPSFKKKYKFNSYKESIKIIKLFKKCMHSKNLILNSSKNKT